MTYEPLSRDELLERGSCCRNGCQNCPWGFRNKYEIKKEENCQIHSSGKENEDV